jgi:hypothetical protein
LIGGGISAITGLFGANQQANAAKAAAAQQAQAAQQAMNIAGVNKAAAVGAQTGATNQIQGLYSPYLQAGQQGMGTLSSMLATPGQGLLAGWNQNFQAPTAEQAAQTPGYQFQLQQGQNAIQSSAAAKGNLLSGGTAKALDQYSQGLASTNYQQTYNNAFQNYLQNYGQFQQNQQNQYARLMGLTGIGTGMTGQMGGLAQTGAGNLASIYGGNTAAMSGLLGTQGAAQASGTMGAANAWAGGINNIGNAATNLGTLSMLGYGQNQNEKLPPADITLGAPGGNFGSGAMPSLGSVGALSSNILGGGTGLPWS